MRRKDRIVLGEIIGVSVFIVDVHSVVDWNFIHSLMWMMSKSLLFRQEKNLTFLIA